MIEPHPTTSEAHLDPAEVADYVGRTISGDGRRRVERHLADCETCTEEVAAIARLARPTASPRWMPYAAAAAVLAGLLVFWPRGGSRVPDDTLRDGGSSVAITVVEPADGAVVAGSATLVWRAVPRALAYRVLVTRSDGDSLWAVHTSDTVVNIPEMAGEGSVTRHWYVDALLADGSSVSSGMRSYRTAP
jgi:hypothetical protein